MSSQSQRGGDDSFNIQAESIHLGVTYSEARQIAEDVFNKNILELGKIAMSVVRERGFDLSEKFFAKLREKFPSAIATMANPDMQYALFTAQREFARSGDQDLEEVLVELLVDRAAQPTRSVFQIVLNESLTVAAKLTVQQLDTLSLMFLLKHSKLKTIRNQSEAKTYIDDYYAPFLERPTREMSDFLHMEYSGCSHLGRHGFDITTTWSHYNNKTFQKGFDRAEFDRWANGDVRLEPLLVPCVCNPSLLRLNVSGAQEIEHFCQQCGLGLNREIVASLQHLHLRSTMNEAEIKRWLVSANPKIQLLFDSWERCIVCQYTLTSIGKIIGNANFRRRTNRELDQEWDKSLSEPFHWNISQYPG
jgi:hypothetical protein